MGKHEGDQKVPLTTTILDNAYKVIEKFNKIPNAMRMHPITFIKLKHLLHQKDINPDSTGLNYNFYGMQIYEDELLPENFIVLLRGLEIIQIIKLEGG